MSADPRSPLDLLSRYEMVLREQLDALGRGDLPGFETAARERDRLGDEMRDIGARDRREGDGAGSGLVPRDPEAERVLAQLRLLSSRVRELDRSVLARLREERDRVKREVRKVEETDPAPVERYLGAEHASAPGAHRLDVVR